MSKTTRIAGSCIAAAMICACAIVTSFKEYDIDQVDLSPLGKQTNYWFAAGVYPEHPPRHRWIIPGIYDEMVWSEPYRVYLTLHGPFDSLRSIQATLIANDTHHISLPVNADTMNAARAMYGDQAYFPSGPFPLDLRWEGFDSLRLVGTFSANSNGNQINEKFELRYRKKYRRVIGNRPWLYIMSI